MAESNIFNLTFKKLYVDLGGWHKHHRHLSACNTGDVGSVPGLGRSSEGKSRGERSLAGCSP